MSTISYDQFQAVDIRVGTIIDAQIPEGSNKLIKLTINFGEEIGEKIIFSGILKWFKPENLINLQTTFVINLEPRKMGDFGYSQGMLFAADAIVDGETQPVLVKFDQRITNGTRMI